MCLDEKRKIYAAFVDYKKAFDTIDRSSLWLKLVQLGITGKIFSVVKNMYSQAKSCVRSNNQVSDLFHSQIGVRQGDNLSPLLFSIYINDLESHLGTDSIGIEIRGGEHPLLFLNLFILLYADDTIILSNSEENLQSSLNSLHQYCEKWKLTVNISKTKIVIFSKRQPKNTPKWTFGQENIEVQEDYTYLGTIFNKANYSSQKSYL
jgi:hypothetical protein